MVRTGHGQLGHLPACPGVYCENRGNVAVEFRLRYCAFPFDYPDSSHLDTGRQPTAFNDAVLASTLEANPRTVVLDETKEATKMDCSKIFHCLCRGLRFPSCVDRLACTIPRSYYLQLHAVQEHLTIYSHLDYPYTLLAAWFIVHCNSYPKFFV